MSEGALPAGLDPNILERAVTVEVHTEHLRNMQHQATVTGRGDPPPTFTFRSDEPDDMQGDNEYPYPLDYLTAAIGL